MTFESHSSELLLIDGPIYYLHHFLAVSSLYRLYNKHVSISCAPLVSFARSKTVIFSSPTHSTSSRVSCRRHFTRMFGSRWDWRLCQVVNNVLCCIILAERTVYHNACFAILCAETTTNSTTIIKVM